MTRVMDGVRLTGRPQAIVLPAPKPKTKAAKVAAARRVEAAAASAAAVRMDSMRRPSGTVAAVPARPAATVAARPTVVARPAVVRPVTPAPTRPAPVAKAPRPQVVAPAPKRQPVVAAPVAAPKATSAPLPALPGAASLAEALSHPDWQATAPRARRRLGWKRPAMAAGLVATALVASTVTVNLLTTPQNVTARAASLAVATPSATPAPAVQAAAVTPTPTPVPQPAGLQSLLDNFAAANPGKFGIVVKNLSTGETAAISPERQIMSASLYKLFVAQRIYQRIDLGQLSYGQAAGGGTGRNISDCLRVMINISDNGCGRALGSMLGWGKQDQALLAEGYHQTSLATPQQTSAGDVAILFERLYNGTLVSPASTDKFMGLLKDQRVNNRLPIGLPKGTVIAHKTGDLDGVVHDAGIVYGPKTNYLVVVTSGPWAAPAGAAPKFADLSAQLWNYFEN